MILKVERWFRVRWETDRRYYEVHLHQDLWGTWVLTRTWGGWRSAQGKTVHQPVPTKPKARPGCWQPCIRSVAGTAIGVEQGSASVVISEEELRGRLRAKGYRLNGEPVH